MMTFLRKNGLLLLSLLVALIAFPPQWYPLPVRLQLTQWFGAADYRPLPESRDPAMIAWRISDERW